MKSSPRANARSEHAMLEETETLMDAEAQQQQRGTPLRRQLTTQQAASSLLSSWFSRRFMSGFAVLFPGVVTFWVIWWFLHLFDSFFSPVYEYVFGFHVFGLGFLTSMAFIFATGVFTSSWIGGVFLGLGEYIIRKVPLVKHIYSAAKQVSGAVSPDHGATNSFRECVIIRHPRNGEYAFAFITGQTMMVTPEGDLDLYVVYVPTNHVYVGDIFLLGEKDVIRSNLSVREGIEVVVSVGMAVPQKLTVVH